MTTTDMKALTLHMIGNAHLDPVWLWQWQEGFQAAKSTFRSALDRMDENPEFVFTSSSAAIYEWIEQNDPAMFAAIRQRIAEGRWRIEGGWWIQPDCNIPGGESFVRQGLYGQRYFREKFGVTATVGYNVDSFGHHAMLPQILARSGMDAYVFMRPQPHEMELPGRVFWWESADGTRVLTFRLPFEYTVSGPKLAEHILRCTEEIQPPMTETVCFYGVGNHGGGPTKENLALIERVNADPDYPTCLFSSPDDFFDAVREQQPSLPTVRGDLQHHASGCYAAHSGVKQWNRQAENLLLAAEKWSSVASQVNGHPYPATALTHAWKLVLFNQFHDILAGTSVEPAYDDARSEYGEAMAIASRELNQAIQSLSWAIDIPHQEEMTPIVVFNPHPWPVRAGVELEFGRLPSPAALLDDEDRPVAFQKVQSLATVTPGWRNRLAFVADVPPLGYRTYRIAQVEAEPEAPSLASTETTIENARLRLTFDPETGWLVSLYDKEHEVEVLAGPSARPVVIADESDTWSHGVLRFDQIVGEFRATRLLVTESGPVRTTMRVESAYAGSRLVQEFTLYDGRDSAEVGVTVDWHEHHRMLKLLFAPSLTGAETTYEIPYGHLVRPDNGEEESGQNWIDRSGTLGGCDLPYGLSILNDAKYSYSATPDEMALTVLRSPIYAHHDPYVPEPDGIYSYIDQGMQHFTYVLLPHAGDWRAAQTVRQAAELNQRPIALFESGHAGALPLAMSFVEIEGESVALGAIKQGEDGNGLIVRCYETSGARTRARIRLQGWSREIDAEFGPSEIKTFLIPASPE
ncbi:MAG TPA: glycoside hydrolase family 38 C-terminal domain-containing protein, partial [Thermomicrobiales bacterium]|nr:glycoside hydrolase family 38 C-terminal domain-containing protein [Thermomicrobiales bacterium]